MLEKVVAARLVNKSPPKRSLPFQCLINTEYLYLISHMHGTSPYCFIRPSTDYTHIIIIIILHYIKLAYFNA